MKNMSKDRKEYHVEFNFRTICIDGINFSIKKCVYFCRIARQNVLIEYRPDMR